MLALIIGFISLFSGSHSPDGHDPEAYADSLKRPLKKREVIDTTGKFLEINRIFIIGNRRTRNQIILRELTLKQGDVIYSSDLPSILELDRKKLINTRLFNKVEVRILELDSIKIDLLVDLNERWYTFPSPIFELSDRNFNEWWQNYNHDFRRVNYGLRLYQFNMRGRNETLRFMAQFGFTRRFELLYRFPYIDKKQKHGLAIDFNFIEAKNLAYGTEDHKYQFLKADDILRRDRIAGLTYSYRRSFYKTHTVKLEYRNAFVEDTIKTLNPLYIKGETRQKMEYTAITYQFNADHRDFFAYPLNGYQFQVSLTKIGIGAGDDVNKVDVNLLYSKYFSLGKKYYLSNNVVGYWSDPQNLSYMNYGVLGLRKQFVRGYEIYVIEGPFHIMNKTTFKKLLFANDYHWADMPIEQFRHIPIALYLKTYADFGYVENYPDYRSLELNTRLSDKLLAGAGLGLDLVSSYDVVLRFEYSINAEGEKGFFFHVKKEF
jgi:outer membrane protein assembly factor BamA